MIRTDDKEAKKNDCGVRYSFLNKPLKRLVARNLIPSVASMVMMGVYGIVDGILIGRRLGPGPMASINLLFPILALTIGLATMVGVGGNSKIAVLLGKNETSKASGVFSVVLSLGIIIGLITSIIVHLGFTQILSSLGNNQELGSYAGEYLKLYNIFFVPVILFFVMERSVRNDGRPNFATGVMIFTSILNIVLDYIFLFPLNLGIGGAALATGLSQTLGACFFVSYFVYKTLKKRNGLIIGSPKGCWHEVLGIATNGSSELFSGLAVGVTTLFYNRQILDFSGPTGLAAFVVVQYFLVLVSEILSGMATGAQPIFSYNYGSGNTDRVQEALKLVMRVGIAVSMIFFIVIRWQAQGLVEVFYPNDPEAILLAVEIAGYISWSFLFMAIGILGSAYFTALEQAAKSLIVSILRGLVLIIFGLSVFPIILGSSGIWLTPVFAEGITGMLVLILVWKKPAKSVQLIANRGANFSKV